MTQRYEWVAAQRADGFPTITACDTAGVSRQAFYDWCQTVDGPPTFKQQVEAAVVAEMGKVHAEFDQTYGSPRMTVELRNRGFCVNHKRVKRLMRSMRDHGFVGVHKPARKRTTIPADTCMPVPDLVRHRFEPGQPDRVWVGDITYVRTGHGWLYLATVLDLGPRRLLGYSMADHMRTELVTNALAMATAARGGRTQGIVFHSDKGAQYFSGTYRQALSSAGVVQSAGRAGVCWDNAVAESFFSSLKRELVHRYRFADRASARRAIFASINRYNNRRLHSSLGYRSPIDWEHQYQSQPQALKAA